MFLHKHITQILASLCLCCTLPAFAETPDMLDSDTWPETVDATVQMILSRLSEEDKLIIRNTKKEDLILFHHGWGTSIRNYYGLWRGNEQLLRSACKGKLCHPDEASMKIIEAVWERLKK